MVVPLRLPFRGKYLLKLKNGVFSNKTHDVPFVVVKSVSEKKD